MNRITVQKLVYFPQFKHVELDALASLFDKVLLHWAGEFLTLEPSSSYSRSVRQNFRFISYEISMGEVVKNSLTAVDYPTELRMLGMTINDHH